SAPAAGSSGCWGRRAPPARPARLGCAGRCPRPTSTSPLSLHDALPIFGARLAGLDYGPGYGTGTFLRPGTGSTTSEYGPRLHPILGYVKLHTGLDFGRGDGAVYAADSGTVVEATWNTAYGNMVIVDHGLWNGQRLTTMY